MERGEPPKWRQDPYGRIRPLDQAQGFISLVNGYAGVLPLARWSLEGPEIDWVDTRGNQGKAHLSQVLAFKVDGQNTQNRYEIIQNIYAQAEPSYWWNREVRLTWVNTTSGDAESERGIITGWDYDGKGSAYRVDGSTEVWFERYDGEFYRIPLNAIQEIEPGFSRGSLYVNFIRDMQRKPWEQYDPEEETAVATSLKTSSDKAKKRPIWRIFSGSGNVYEVTDLTLSKEGTLTDTEGDSVVVERIERAHLLGSDEKHLSREEFIAEAFPSLDLPSHASAEKRWVVTVHGGGLLVIPEQITGAALSRHLLLEKGSHTVTAIEAIESAHLWGQPKEKLLPHLIRYLQRNGVIPDPTKAEAQAPSQEKKPAKKKESLYKAKSSELAHPDRWYPLEELELKHGKLQTMGYLIPVGSLTAIQKGRKKLTKMQFIKEAFPEKQYLPEYFLSSDTDLPVWYKTSSTPLFARGTLGELWQEDPEELTRVELTTHEAHALGYLESHDFYIPLVQHILAQEEKEETQDAPVVYRIYGPDLAEAGVPLTANPIIRRDEDGWLCLSENSSYSIQIGTITKVEREQGKETRQISRLQFVEEAFSQAGSFLPSEWLNQKAEALSEVYVGGDLGWIPLANLEEVPLEDLEMVGFIGSSYDFYVEWVRHEQRKRKKEAEEEVKPTVDDIIRGGAPEKEAAASLIQGLYGGLLVTDVRSACRSWACDSGIPEETPSTEWHGASKQPPIEMPVVEIETNNKKETNMFANLTNMFKIGPAEDLGLNVKVTMSGQVAVYDGGSASYVVPSSFGKKLKLEQVMEDFTMDIPAMVMPCPMHELKENDLVLDGKGISLVLGVTDSTIDALSVERKTKTVIVPMSHQFMGNQNFVSKLVPFNVLAGGGMNPMMLMMLMGKMGKKDKDSKGFDMSQMLPFLMMSGGMGGAAPGLTTNPFGSLFGGAPATSVPVAGLPEDFDVNPVLKKLADYGGAVIVNIKDPFDETTAVTGRIKYVSGVNFTIVLPTGGEVKGTIADVDHVASAANPAKTLKLV